MKMRWVFAAVFLCMSAQLASSQDMPLPRGRAGERLEQWKKIRLMEALQLDEETSLRFFARYNKHMEQMRTIAKERLDIIDALQMQTKGRGGDAEIERSITELIHLEEKVVNARLKFLEDLKEVVTVKQIGAYIVFERNFNQNLREIMQEIAKERWDRRGGAR